MTFQTTLIGYTPNIGLSFNYFVNKNESLGIEYNIFRTKSFIIHPKNSKNVSFSNSTSSSDFSYQNTCNIIIRYQRLIQKNNFLQTSFNGGIGISQFNEFTNYKVAGHNYFFGPYYEKVYDLQYLPIISGGITIFKRKRLFTFFSELNIIYNIKQFQPLLKLGIQFNILDKKKNKTD